MKKLTDKIRLEIRFLTGLVIMTLILPSLARAELSSFAEASEDKLPFTFSGYGERGRKSTAEDYEEEDTDDEYTYQNYHLKFEQEISERLNYDLSSFVYDKDYQDRNSLDNISRIFKTNWTYYLKKPKEESLKLDFKLEYKKKRYKNTPVNEYDEIRFVPSLTLGRKNLYTFDLALGIDNFDYLESGEDDQFKVFGRVEGKRYSIEKKLMLTGAYKLETTQKEKMNRKRTKQEILGGFDYLFELPWIYKIMTRTDWGQRDTKEEEPFDSLRSLRVNTELVEIERDEDYDYEYWRYYTKTEHRISPKLKAAVKYQYFRKDYLNADLDHCGFYLQNSWDYEVLDDEKQRIGIDLGLEHKEVKYNLKIGNNYRKESVEMKAGYKRKKNWQTAIGLEENFYDSTNDKKRTYLRFSAEKLFLEGDLVLSLDLKYKYTDYTKQEDKEQESVRTAFRYRF